MYINTICFTNLLFTCDDYPAQLIGFHMQNSTDNARVPTEDSEKALYAWGPPEDASDVQYRQSDAGCIRTCRDGEWGTGVRGAFCIQHTTVLRLPF